MEKSREDKPGKSPASDCGEERATTATRRRFLKKSGTAAVVTTLAAQPVWGVCTISGFQSGGSQFQDDDPCKVPNASGRSPGFWSRAMYNGNAVISAFPSIPSNRKADLRCYIDSVKASSTFTIPSTGETWSVATALSSSGGLAWNLAAIYLNCHFGFPGFDIAPPPGVGSFDCQDWITHFDALVFIAGGSDAPFNAVFTDGSTTWNALPAGNLCL